MKAYVINLADRTDRWESVLKQEKKFPFQLTRFNASEAKDFSGIQDSYLPPAVLACFDSHKKLLSTFLETEEDFALVLEDDFVVKGCLSSKYFEDLLDLNFDFLQIGFLHTTYFQSISIINRNLFDSFYKLLAKFSNLVSLSKFRNFLLNKQLVLEQLRVPYRLVLHDVRPGTHAYLISRKLAFALQSMNSPTFLSADGLYIALGPMRTFKMGRLRRSKIAQSQSPSSIIQN